jgi:hypothetical protein
MRALRTGNIAVGACASTADGEIICSARNLVLTTTLQPCLQCAAAIRLGPVAAVRFAGADRYWDGCHDFGRLSAREADRAQRPGPGRAAMNSAPSPP